MGSDVFDEVRPDGHGDRPLHRLSKEAPRQRAPSRPAATTSCEGACEPRAWSSGRDVHAPEVMLQPVRGAHDEVFYRNTKRIPATSDGRREQVTPGTAHPALACDGRYRYRRKEARQLLLYPLIKAHLATIPPVVSFRGLLCRHRRPKASFGWLLAHDVAVVVARRVTANRARLAGMESQPGADRDQ